MYSSKLSTEARQTIGRYEKTFNSAYKFLGNVAANNVPGFWLSTAKNAHLYYKDAYFAYIVFEPLSIKFFKQYNNRIHEGTHDKSSMLFGKPLQDLARKHNLSPSPVSFDGPEIMSASFSTPLVFFEDLIDLIKNICRN